MELVYIIVSIFAVYGFFKAVVQLITFIMTTKKIQTREIIFTLKLVDGEELLEGAVRWFFRNNGHRNGINVKLLIADEELTEEAKSIAGKISEEYGDAVIYGKP